MDFLSAAQTKAFRERRSEAEMRLMLAVSIMLASAALAATPARLSLTLARDGQPLATIVIAKEATRAAQFAAADLQWHLQQITGADFPIKHDDEPVAGVRLLVGDSKAVQGLGLAPLNLGKQEYLIRFLPEAIVMMGRDRDDRGIVQWSPTPSPEAVATWPSIWDEQGTMYAVYEFLERYCDVRWLNPTESGSEIPKRPTLTVTGSELRRAPFMRYRYAAYPSAEGYDAYTGLWPADSDGYKTWEAAAYPDLHRKFSDRNAYLHAKRGWNMLFRLRHREGGEICLGNHSLYGYYRRFWAPEAGQEALFEGKHPDWFAQGYAGQPPQMCYTSRGLIEQVAKDACEYFETGKVYPGAQAGGDCFCVEPMDNDQFCKCPDCQKWLTGRDADSPFFTNGRHSDYFFQFVNEVAKIVGQKHPDKHIVCLSYMTHGAPPEKVKLEPNVIVQYCFACNRLNFDRASYEHEIDLLKQWRQTNPTRTMYLWLYYTFPVEIANGGGFHCFPGFFAHAIGEQFDLFKRYDYRGVFHCGYGQDVEAYVTYRLMDNPDLRVEALLDEYFTRLYGPAAAPMRQLYDTIEQTYSNPANYPEAIATKRIEGHHHQTEEVAWGYLGNERRMAQMQKLMDQAIAAAQTPEQKHRVELFRLGTWEYMLAGRKLYMEHAKARYGGQAAVLRVPYVFSFDPANPKADWSEALSLTGFRSRLAEPTRRKPGARLLTDGAYLYLRVEEDMPQDKLRSTEDVASGDHWDILLATSRTGPERRMLLNPDKALWRGDRQLEIAQLYRSEPQSYSISLRLPLSEIGKAPGGHILLNLARRSPGSDDEPMWSPTFGDFEDPAAMRELILDGPETIPAALPDGDFRRLDSDGLVARWGLSEGKGNTVRSASGNLTGALVNKAQWQKEGDRSVVRLEDSRRQYLDFGSPPELNLTGPLSLLMWVKYEPTDMWYPALLGKGYEATGTYGLHVRPGNTPWFEIDAPDGTRNMYNPTDLPLPAGQWCHVAATYDGSTMRVFVNGREAGAGKLVATTIRTNDEPLRFGWLGSYGYFNGCVRDLSVYGRAVSAEEVFGHYQRER